MRVLICVPCLYNSTVTTQCIDSIISLGCDILIADNGAEQAVKDVINSYKDLPNVKIIHKDVNIFVNPIWNEFLQIFISSGYSHCIIMNSDLVIHRDFMKVCLNRWAANPDEILIPILPDNIPEGNINTDIQEATRVYEGIAGFCFSLTKRQAEAVANIPPTLTLWFGDNFIFSILKSKYPILVVPNLFAYHAWSQSVSKLPNFTDIIEEDKRQWAIISESGIIEEKIRLLLAE